MQEYKGLAHLFQLDITFRGIQASELPGGLAEFAVAATL